MKTNFTEKWICIQIVYKLNPKDIYDAATNSLKEWHLPLRVANKHRNFFRVALAREIVKNPNSNVEIKITYYDPYTNELWDSDRRMLIKQAVIEMKTLQQKLAESMEEFNVSLFRKEAPDIDEKSNFLRNELSLIREKITELEELPIKQKLISNQ